MPEATHSHAKSHHRSDPSAKAQTKSVLIAVSTPLSYAVVAPIVRELARSPQLRISVTARHGGAAGARGFLEAPVRYLPSFVAKSLRFDACLCPGFHFHSHRAQHSIELFHGVSFKNYAVHKKLDEFEHLFVIGEYHRMKMVRRGLLKEGDDRARRVGMPKTDPLVSAPRNTTLLTALGLDPALPTVLYAPTRSGEAGSSLEHGGLAQVDALSRLPVNVIVKLHDRSQAAYRKGLPTDYPAEMEVMERRCARFRLYPGHDIIPAMLAADVLVSDLSSAANEFLLRDKPVLYLSAPRHEAKLRSSHAESYPGDPFDLDYMRCAGEVVDGDRLVAAVDRALERPDAKSPERRERAELLFYNPGRATQTALETLYSILEIADVAHQPAPYRPSPVTRQGA